MNTTYVNPDAPNAEITDAAVRSMLMQGQQGQNTYQNGGYYPGSYPNPFGVQSQNMVSMPTTESRANIGYPTPQMQQYNPMQNGIAPAWVPGAGTFPQISQNPQAYQMQGYNGYPIGVDPNNWIFEYMKNNTAAKNTWGENYWTMQKPIEQPPIDWTPKPQQQYTDFYAQYGMAGVPSQPPQMMPPAAPNLTFAPVQETWLDAAKKNWKNL